MHGDPRFVDQVLAGLLFVPEEASFPEVESDTSFEDATMQAMTEPIGEPCCEDFGRTLHHHWGGTSTP